jgi:hypothetical protein
MLDESGTVVPLAAGITKSAISRSPGFGTVPHNATLDSPKRTQRSSESNACVVLTIPLSFKKSPASHGCTRKSESFMGPM